jgi:DNA polymerase-3 subunit epsilon
MNNKDITAFCDLKNKKGAPKKPKLEELYEILFLEPMPNAHNAMADAAATRRCFYELQSRGII